MEGDLTDQSSLDTAMMETKPDEVYNLAAQSFVGTSWNQPVLTGDMTGIGAVRLLESIRHFCKDARVYQASSSEMFGKPQEIPQKETTKFSPGSPYGCAKAYAYFMCVDYRETYNMFISNGILSNHESPRRGMDYVTHKITDGVARIHLGFAKEIRLGNLEARRDWGFAGDYVQAMWLMLQHEIPDDFIISTGETHSVREFVEMAFDEVGLDWEDHVKIDPKYLRPSEVNYLIGDNSKAKQILGWEPKLKFEDIIKMMVHADIERIMYEKHIS